jgi:formate transporter
MEQTPGVEIISPAVMAEKAVNTAELKAGYVPLKTFLLAIMAGMFVATGGLVSTTTTSGTADMLPYGIIRLVAGITFSFALMMVLISGSELFTGNILLVMACLSKRISWGSMLKNWVLVYIGNLVGSLMLAGMVFAGKQYLNGHGLVGVNILTVAESKTSLDWVQAFWLGVLCNFLVCLGVWMAYSGRSTIDKMVAVIPSITAFVAAGFEHSVANMYFIPIGLLVKNFGSNAFFEMIGKTPAAFPHLTVSNFLFQNLLPVTLGNIVGGGFFIGVMYWWIYLYRKQPAS